MTDNARSAPSVKGMTGYVVSNCPQMSYERYVLMPSYRESSRHLPYNGDLRHMVANSGQADTQLGHLGIECGGLHA